MALLSARHLLRCGYHAPVSIATTPIAASRRTFFKFLTDASDIQRISATRRLPYAADDLFDIIIDIEAYKTFVPGCLDSRVTAWSKPETDGRRLPAQAELSIAYGGFNEKFTSVLICEPGVSVKAFSGPRSDGQKPNPKRGELKSVIKRLAADWTIHPLGIKSESSDLLTEVRLVVDFQFNVPIYTILSKSLSNMITDAMMVGFELRAAEKLGMNNES
ncbi:hypothetical protein CDD82_6907 [Ophiocordyceps australis]|uniref:Coenzyme Q-binding protein COQ10 START domain-containing protein n=1 Tax=Ophiocordyceps australis TaxID=1399860 RepID=A0A2C5YV94_9HYPO|nr:hypothetical protein CDD82_6907 [Ophiocordyceps australis]